MVTVKVCDNPGGIRTTRSTTGMRCVQVVGMGVFAKVGQTTRADASKTLITCDKRSLFRLKASSLLETIVASIIFLTVFTLSVEIVTRVARPSENKELNEIIALQRVDVCRNELNVMDVCDDLSYKVFDTDTVWIEVRPCALHDNLLQVTLSTPVGPSDKIMRLTYLIRRQAENETNW